MIKNYISLCAIIILIGSSVSHAITHDELLALQKQSSSAQAPLSSKPPKYQRTKSVGLLEGSDILSNGKIWTLVPKNAILCTPKYHSSKVVAEPKGKFVVWKDFLAKNPAWLSCHSVDMKTATGATKISFEKYQTLLQRGKIIVAVHNRGPVSIASGTIELTPSK